MTLLLEPPTLATPPAEAPDIWWELDPASTGIIDGGSGYRYTEHRGDYPWPEGDVVHCWEGVNTWEMDPVPQRCYGPSSDTPSMDDLKVHSASCMLADGHAGPHLFIPDDSWAISFS